MSFPYDSSASSHNQRYPQPVSPQSYGAYDQQAYNHVGYPDISQSQKYASQLAYSPTPSGAPGSTEYDSYGPSFSPTSTQFAQLASPHGNPGAMTFNPRQRHQSTSAVSLSGAPHPPPRRQSGEGQMRSAHEGYEFVPSQPYYNEPRHAHPVRDLGSGQSPTDSALALEKPYVCDICHTRFARQHDCRRHRETHVVNASGEKPHHCVVCGKSFTRKDALKRHTNQKGCDINASANVSQSSRSSSSSSPQQIAGTFYPVGNVPHNSAGTYY